MKAAAHSVVMAVVMALGAVACSKHDGGSKATGGMAGAAVAMGGSAGSASGGASGGATGGSASGAAQGGKPNNGPAITSAPAAWEPPADCGGIGNLCPNLSGCAARSTCQLEGNVCIPALVPGATALPSKSMERPYCAAYTCMTFEEASCFCSGEAGKTEPRCQSPGALAGLCQGTKGSCDADRPCCDGVSCVSHGTFSACEKTCSADTDCETGCCTDLFDTGTKICAVKAECDNPCKKRGEACDPGSATMANNCCRGSCLDSENPDWAGCRPYCTTNADCPDTGCCLPFSNTNNGFCTEAIYCMCSALDEPCGPGNPNCCDGGVCAGTTAETVKCLQQCTQPTDCASGCCAPLKDSTTSVCEPPEYCP
ncbi:MAG TPA: hypothetical protein VIW29_19190 [Polyangiaceae bacterium]